VEEHRKEGIDVFKSQDQEMTEITITSYPQWKRGKKEVKGYLGNLSFFFNLSKKSNKTIKYDTKQLSN
jgi:hypothetical protein